MSSESTKLTRAYLIVGPESAGNRMMARSFDTAGVSNIYSKNGEYISGPHKVTFSENPLLVSMSIPYNQVWPNIANIYHTMKSKYDEVTIICLDRETDFMAKSQVVQERVTKEETAYKNIERARREIKEYCEKIGVTPLRIQYEEFVTDAEYRKETFESLGLPKPTIEYFNANERGI